MSPRHQREMYDEIRRLALERFNTVRAQAYVSGGLAEGLETVFAQTPGVLGFLRGRARRGPAGLPGGARDRQRVAPASPGRAGG